MKWNISITVSTQFVYCQYLLMKRVFFTKPMRNSKISDCIYNTICDVNGVQILRPFNPPPPPNFTDFWVFVDYWSKSLRKQIIFTKLTLRPYLLLHNWQSRLIYGDVFTYSIFVHYVIKCLDLDHFDCLESISNATKFPRNCFQI